MRTWSSNDFVSNKMHVVVDEGMVHVLLKSSAIVACATVENMYM